MSQIKNKNGEFIENPCPVCQEEAEIMCGCPRNDSKCTNGHVWHTCMVHNKIVIGTLGHSITATNICSCKS